MQKFVYKYLLTYGSYKVNFLKSLKENYKLDIIHNYSQQKMQMIQCKTPTNKIDAVLLQSVSAEQLLSLYLCTHPVSTFNSPIQLCIILKPQRAILTLSLPDRPKPVPSLFYCLMTDDFTCQGRASGCRERVKPIKKQQINMFHCYLLTTFQPAIFKLWKFFQDAVARINRF